MREALRSLRGLVLGETWSLPLGVALALGAAAALRTWVLPSGLWEHLGGFVLLAALLAALWASLARRR